MTSKRRTWSDLRLAPCYPLGEAAAYLHLPKSTLRNWVCGRRYPVASGRRRVPPLIELPDPNRPVLSFINMVEAHVLAAIRRDHAVSLPHIRAALLFVRRQMNSERPLVDQQFETNGVHLFVDHLGELINASKAGQIAMSGVFRTHLKRIARDASGIPIRLFPFTHGASVNEAAVVMIDPSISFGRPIIARSGTPIAVIAERFRAGESIDSIADDFSLSVAEIEEALRCEPPRMAA